jgi:hypothetical protein
MKTLKYEEVFRQEYRDLAGARSCLERFIEKVYNQKRLHSALGYRPPAEFEQVWQAPSHAGVEECRSSLEEQRIWGGSQGALSRETLPATGFYGGRGCNRHSRVAPMPPSYLPGYAGGPHSDGHRMRFRRHLGISLENKPAHAAVAGCRMTLCPRSSKCPRSSTLLTRYRRSADGLARSK